MIISFLVNGRASRQPGFDVPFVLILLVASTELVTLFEIGQFAR